VRLEIRTALERSIPIIPILIDGAQMPTREQLPADISKLAQLNSIKVIYRRSERNERQLVADVQQALISAA